MCLRCVHVSNLSDGRCLLQRQACKNSQSVKFSIFICLKARVVIAGEWCGFKKSVKIIMTHSVGVYSKIPCIQAKKVALGIQ